MKQHFLHRKGKTLLCMLTIMSLLFNIAIVRIGVASPQTKAYVDPPSILDSTLVPGENFTINVNVFNITNLYGYEIHLYYDTSILGGLSVDLPPGHFLTPVDPTKIFIVALETNDAWNATHGRVLATVMLLWPEPPKNGSGTLITVTFNVTGIGSCPLDLNPAKLGNPDGEPIEHEDVDGYFTNLPDVAVVSVIPAAVQAYPTWTIPLNITVTVLNNDTAPVNFTVTAYYENITAAYEIGTQNVTNLSGGSQLNLTFSWNLADVSWGNYTIKAVASTVADEADTADNTYIDGTVTIKIPGDVDGNGIVEWTDFGDLALAYGSSEGDANFNPQVDFDNNGIIEWTDFGDLALHYGESTTAY